MIIYFCVKKELLELSYYDGYLFSLFISFEHRLYQQKPHGMVGDKYPKRPEKKKLLYLLNTTHH